MSFSLFFFLFFSLFLHCFLQIFCKMPLFSSLVNYAELFLRTVLNKRSSNGFLSFFFLFLLVSFKISAWEIIFKNYFFLHFEVFMLYILSLSTNMSIYYAISLYLKTIHSFLNISFKCWEKQRTTMQHIKIELLRNVLFIMNMRTCFSRRIGLIKSFTTKASSYLFLSLELFRGFFFVINGLAYPYLVNQWEVTKWGIISFYKIFSN